MSNLLPDAAQQVIRREYRARFILAGAALAIGAALFTILALSPSYGALFITQPRVRAQATQLQQSKSDSADIARAQILMTQFSPVASASSSVTTAIRQAISDRPTGVRIDNISYTAGVSDTIALGGIAESREMIDKYRATLLADPYFTSVKLPVGDLIGALGGRFTITVAGHF